jgi:hypothetical protein
VKSREKQGLTGVSGNSMESRVPALDGEAVSITPLESTSLVDFLRVEDRLDLKEGNDFMDEGEKRDKVWDKI